MAAYTEGESAATLAQQFGVARNSIDAILSDAKVPRHLKRMTPQLVEQAVASYRAGNSLAAVGRDLGVAPTTIRDALLRGGIALRPRRGSGEWRAGRGA